MARNLARSFSVEIAPLLALMIVERHREYAAANPRMARELLRLMGNGARRVSAEAPVRSPAEEPPAIAVAVEEGRLGSPSSSSTQPSIDPPETAAVSGGCKTDSCGG